MFNVLLGGTLYQDLSTQKPSQIEHQQKPPYERPVHQVKILSETPLYEVLQKKEIAVNSYHHQAIKDLAEGLQAMAYATDGLVEAIYMPEKKYVRAIQWHPEFLFRRDENSFKILEDFVAVMQRV